MYHQARAVHHTMPEDSQAFITEWKGKPIDGKPACLLVVSERLLILLLSSYCGTCP